MKDGKEDWMPTRIDNFIVWGHGISFIREIMCTLRENFEIIVIHREDITDMNKFIDGIYGCDTYPLSHLRAKTRYLLTVPEEIISITVRNHNVQEREAGRGAFRGVQCDHVVSVKNEIRNKFNPRENGKRTENHVIHGSDYESQVDYILKFLGVKNKEYYTRKKPYHLIGIYNKKIQKKVDELLINILGKGYIKAKETPHFKYLNNNKKAYNDYFFPHMGKELKEDHFPEAFDLLIKNFDKVPPPIVRGDKVLDGGHRVAIAKFKEYKEILCLQ